MPLFTVAERDRVRERVLALAAADARVTAGAVVGSMALAEGDRWSDLDLTFAVVEGVPILDVLNDWTRTLASECDAVTLFDLPAGPSLYRVLLLPGCLQCDLSFTPAPAFGATGPRFRLLFGEAIARPHTPPPAAEELFGYAVHHALRARFCLARGRLWQAEYWQSALRDYALHLACLRHGLPAAHGRGFDDLPAETRAPFADTLARSLEPAELLRALDAAITGLLREAEQAEAVRALAGLVAPRLRELTRGLAVESSDAAG
jgi:hypothetical protein